VSLNLIPFSTIFVSNADLSNHSGTTRAAMAEDQLSAARREVIDILVPEIYFVNERCDGVFLGMSLLLP